MAERGKDAVKQTSPDQHTVEPEDEGEMKMMVDAESSGEELVEGVEAGENEEAADSSVRRVEYKNMKKADLITACEQMEKVAHAMNTQLTSHELNINALLNDKELLKNQLAQQEEVLDSLDEALTKKDEKIKEYEHKLSGVEGYENLEKPPLNPAVSPSDTRSASSAQEKPQHSSSAVKYDIDESHPDWADPLSRRKHIIRG